MGAAGLMTDREVTSRLQAYINVEAAGSGGTANLFEAGPGNGWLIGSWARRAPHPRGASFGIEIYRRLPNDTDFTVLARQGIPGLNFALVGDGYAYHTARDVPERIKPKTLRETGENVVAIATALDRVDVTRRTPWGATFFDIGGVAALSYSMVAGWVIAATSLLFGVMAMVRVTAAAVRTGGGWRWVLTAIWSALGLALAAAAMIGATWALRAAREVYHPWYARPDRLFLLLLAVGTTAAWAMSRAGRWLPPRARGMRHPSVTWSLTLPLWMAMAVAALWVAPGAAFLWTVPLLTAGILLMLTPPESDPALRITSTVVLAVTATLWLRDTVELLRFMVAVFGRLPMVTPVPVYAGVMLMAGVMVAPPFIATVASTRPMVRPSLVTALCLLSVVIAAGLAYSAPAYTSEQPLRRYVRALQEADGTSAVWEVGSIEPGLDLAIGRAGWMEPAVDRRPRERAVGPARASLRIPDHGPVARPRAARGGRVRRQARGSGSRGRDHGRPAPPGHRRLLPAARRGDPGAIEPARRPAPRTLDGHVHRPSRGRHRLARHLRRQGRRAGARNPARRDRLRVRGRPRLAAPARVAAAGSRRLDRQRDLDRARRRAAAAGA